MGSITKFISPDAASMVCAREAINSPREQKASDAIRHMIRQLQQRPADRHAECERTEATNTTHFDDQHAPGATAGMTSMYCQLGMGEATSRFSSFCGALPRSRIRCPRSPEPIRFMPEQPGDEEIDVARAGLPHQLVLRLHRVAPSRRRLDGATRPASAQSRASGLVLSYR